MFSRLCEQRAAISSVLSDRTVTKLAEEKQLALQHSQWQVIEEILPVLQALKCATVVLSADTYVSVSNVFPVMHALISIHLQPSDDDSATVESFKAEVRRSLTQRLFDESVPIINKLPAISAFCDPRHKHLTFLSDTQKIAVKEHVFELMTAGIVQEEHEDAAVSDPTEDDVEDEHTYSKKPKILRQSSAMKLLLGSDYGRTPTNSVENTELQSQFLSYCKEAVMPLDSDPLNWWKTEGQRRYKMLVPVVLAYLSIPATSVSSERVRQNSYTHNCPALCFFEEKCDIYNCLMYVCAP